MTSSESSAIAENHATGTLSGHNQPEYKVSELASALKRTIEDAYGHVRLRGEISGFKRAASGHLYMDLKDDKAVINAVCWRGVASKLRTNPENGLEVICSGRISTYPGRSNYQLIIESMELAGAGALMALLEQRKKALHAEGLFDPSRKLPLPYLPKVIGVITSPSGAVIRDILHRISERFPVHILVWPVAVQGSGAHEPIAAAIDGFNALDADSRIPKPDLLIVARGGGSLEDLWCFNEELVVRAAANSKIPLISAVGHETDTTLIDYAASKRAPTPTAAAEMAVPVRLELTEQLHVMQQRLNRAITHYLTRHRQSLEAMSRGLISPEQMLEYRMQRLDEWERRMHSAMQQRLQQQSMQMTRLGELLLRLSPAQRMAQQQQTLDSLSDHLHRLARGLIEQKATRLSLISHYVTTQSIAERQKRATERLSQASANLHRYSTQIITQKTERFHHAVRMLESLSHHNILRRGFAYVTGASGEAITSHHKVSDAAMHLHFHDGAVEIMRTDTTNHNNKTKMSQPKVTAKKKQPAASPHQPRLL